MIARFLRWWLGELSAAFGARRGPAVAAGDMLRFDLDAARVAVVQRRNGREQELGQLARGPDGDAATRESLSALLAGLRPESTFCELRVAPDLALVKDIELPVAARENLRQVIGFEMERQTPFRAADVYFGHTVAGAGESGRTLRVRVAVVPRATADEALGLVGEWGLEAVDGYLDAPADGGPVTFGFRGAGYRTPGTGRSVALLATVNVLLLVAATAIPIVDQRRQLGVLDRVLEESRARAAAASEIETEARRLAGGFEHLRAQRGGRPTVVEVLEEISVRLPDSTWLFRLEIRGDTAHLQGSSSAASSLVAILEESALFSGVRFASPVVREGNSGRERFHLSAQIVPRPDAPVAGAARPGPVSG